MSFFKKLTQEFNELKANLSDKPKEKKQETDTEPRSDHGTPYQPAYGGPAQHDSHQDYQQQPSYSQPQQQQHGSYPAPPPQHSSPPGQPLLPPGWIAQFDQNSQRWYYIEQATGRTQWDPPQPPQQYGGYGAPPPQQYGAPLPAGQYSHDRGHGQSSNFYNQYGGAQPGYDQNHASNSQQYYGGGGEVKDHKPKDKGNKNMLLAGAAGLAVGGVAGAMIAHDSDSDEEHHSSAHAYGGAPAAYGSDPSASAGYGQPAPPPPANDSDAESLHEAQQDYNQAVEAAADSDASSDELEDLQEAREELEEEQEEYDED